MGKMFTIGIATGVVLTLGLQEISKLLKENIGLRKEINVLKKEQK